jgi:hypothetical protein
MGKHNPKHMPQAEHSLLADRLGEECFDLGQ